LLQAPENKVCLRVKTKYISNITDMMKRASFENLSSVHVEDAVQVIGTIVSLPRTIVKDRWHDGFSTSDLNVGDTIFFSHSVISEYYQSEHNGDPIYKNMVRYKEHEYFFADITQIYAVRKDDSWYMINGYVMAMPFHEDKIFVQQVFRDSHKAKSSGCLKIGSAKTTVKPIDVKAGDEIYYNPNKAIKYQLNGKHFIILQQHHVLGKEV
jgi:hypothetical protein